jgi:hypothetical protein
VTGTLTLEQRAAIAAGYEDHTPADLARVLGLPYDAVVHHVRRFRRAGGWSTPLRLPPCTECGAVVAGPPGQVRHRARARAFQARWRREQRADLRATGTPEAIEAARLGNLRNATRHYRALPAERQAELLADRKRRGEAEYRETLAAADRNRDVWSEEDDAYILATMGRAGREVGLALGRTLWAVYARRGMLRREQAAAASAAAPMRRRGAAGLSPPPACPPDAPGRRSAAGRARAT